MPIDGGFILGAFLTIVVVLVVLFVLVTLFRSIRIIKQGFTGVVERLGRFHRVLQPGLNFLVPFIDRVAYHVDMREQVRSFPPQPATRMRAHAASSETAAVPRTRTSRW